MCSKVSYSGDMWVCHACGRTDDGRTECEDRARIRETEFAIDLNKARLLDDLRLAVLLISTAMSYSDSYRSTLFKLQNKKRDTFIKPLGGGGTVL